MCPLPCGFSARKPPQRFQENPRGCMRGGKVPPCILRSSKKIARLRFLLRRACTARGTTQLASFCRRRFVGLNQALCFYAALRKTFTRLLFQGFSSEVIGFLASPFAGSHQPPTLWKMTTSTVFVTAFCYVIAHILCAARRFVKGFSHFLRINFAMLARNVRSLCGNSRRRAFLR